MYFYKKRMITKMSIQSDEQDCCLEKNLHFLMNHKNIRAGLFSVSYKTSIQKPAQSFVNFRHVSPQTIVFSETGSTACGYL